MTNGESLLSKFAIHIILGLVGVLIGLLGWLGKRYVLIMDKHGQKIDEMGNRLIRVEEKVELNSEHLEQLNGNANGKSSHKVGGRRKRSSKN